MNGYVIDGRVHAHRELADPDKAFGGHREPGVEVFTFAVVTLAVLPPRRESESRGRQEVLSSGSLPHFVANLSGAEPARITMGISMNEDGSRMDRFERGLEHLLELAARHDELIARLAERQALLSETQAAVQQQLQGLAAEQQQLLTAQVVFVDETRRALDAMQRRSEEQFRLLAESQRRTDERLAESQRQTEERFRAVAEFQRQTEERFRALAEFQRQTEERFGALAEAQQQSEKRIRTLADVVEALIRPERPA